MTPLRRILALLLFLAVAAPALRAGQPNFKKYPLRLNILFSRSSSHYPVINLPSANIPADALAGTAGGEDGGGGPPQLVNLPLYENPDPVFFGLGRADIISSDIPQGLNFSYDNCLAKIDVTMPHQPLLARWKKPGQVVELLIPLPNTRPGRPQEWDRCDMTVALQNYVYLLLHNGMLVRVTQDGFARKPALHQFIEGIATTNNLQPAPVSPAMLIHTQ
jgi:hypothetical protein